MSIIIKNDEKKFNFIPEGTHQAVCYGIWDIGDQQIIWNGQTKTQHKIIIGWEINATIPEGEYTGKRFVITNRYTLSLSEKSNLRKHIEAWMGKKFNEQTLKEKGFDIEKLIGKNCFLNIIHTEKAGKTYSNISAILAIPTGTPLLTPENKTTPPEWVSKLMPKNQIENESQVPVEENPFAGDDVEF